jgi:uncharacterized protein
MKTIKKKVAKPNVLKKAWFIVFLILICALVFGYFYFMKRPTAQSDVENEKIIFQKQGELTFLTVKDQVISQLDIEIAATEYTREKGLMARTQMEENQGMLFIFDYPKIQSFWMKNTILPLDLIFVDESDRIVHINHDAIPFSESLISSEKPSQYVVEVNAGYCRKNQIVVGGKIRWKKL